MLRLCRALGVACLFAVCTALVIGLLMDALYLGLKLAFGEPIDWSHVRLLRQAALATIPANLVILLVSQFVASRRR